MENTHFLKGEALWNTLCRLCGLCLLKPVSKHTTSLMQIACIFLFRSCLEPCLPPSPRHSPPPPPAGHHSCLLGLDLEEEASKTLVMQTFVFWTLRFGRCPVDITKSNGSDKGNTIADLRVNSLPCYRHSEVPSTCAWLWLRVILHSFLLFF